jgi:acyl carrier protein
MALTQTEAFSAVQEAVVGALGVDEDEAGPDATLMDELGAESIDLLDILFRIERSTGIKIQAADLATYIQGGISDEEFSDENELISEQGLEQLKKVMPQIDPDELRGKLEAEKVITLFTVQNLADMVAQRAEGGAE